MFQSLMLPMGPMVFPSAQFASPLPLHQYRLNQDPNPLVITRKPPQKLLHNQTIAVKYLKPPALPPSGDIVLRKLPDRQVNYSLLYFGVSTDNDYFQFY